MSKPTKGAIYLQSLGEARCEGKWDDVPELVRKVRKHTTDRACLTLTAEIEHSITKASQKQRPASRPATAVSPQDIDISNVLPKLLEAVENENTYLEDKFQAQVCVGWLHWSVGEYNLAAVRLPQIRDPEYAEFEQFDSISEWTQVCALKAAYFKANCFSRDENRVAALAVFESALSPSSGIWSGQKGGKQLRFWAELFLTEYCMLQTQALERGEKTLHDADSLAPFRSWAKYWESSTGQGIPLVGGYGFKGAVPRRRVWFEYYSAISGILQQDLPFPTAHVNAVTNEASARNQLRIELKKVEAAYEGLLLTETTFPRADEEREEVETFVSIVTKNWSVLSGRDWHGHDLGPGGKEGLSRGILEVLYRAATKTFHSTSILRYLFTIHLSVAEFDLAFSAFDSYMEIVKKGKARVDKTGHAEPSLDDDATVVETISRAITALCKYGSQAAAEKAYNLGMELEEMLLHLPGPLPNTEDAISTLDEENNEGVLTHPRISAQSHGLAWQAIGLSQAQWSRTTFDAPTRTEMQTKAIRSFQKSLSPDNGNPTDVRTLFTLGLLLAEQRELTAAIDIVKAALMSHRKKIDQSLEAGSYWRERSLIPLWHLLALLLSARQDFLMAARACEGAFEQFNDPTVLFGSLTLDGGYRSDHLNEAEAKSQSKGLVDEMDDLEKEGIIEVKMTQLALLELLEGPHIAVNASHELLVLFTRLFGSVQSANPPKTQKTHMEVPKSSAGTIRSLRGSIFGSKADKHARPITQQGDGPDSQKSIGASERPTTMQTVASTTTAAPTIQVTQEHGDSGEGRHPSKAGSIRGRRSESTRRNSLKKRDGSAHQRRATSSAGQPRSPTVVDGEDFFTPFSEGAANDRPDFFARNSKGSISRQSFSKSPGLPRFDSTVSSANKSIANSDGPILDSLSPPNPLPIIQFPAEDVNRQRQTILVKVWLMIATFYRHAGMYRDARGAISEAKTIVDSLEADIANNVNSSMTINDPAWGCKKGIEELWSDVRSEFGFLAIDEGSPYMARGLFEEALLHYPNHASAIVGLSNILLDIYSETLLPPPAIPGIKPFDGDSTNLIAAMNTREVAQSPIAPANGESLELPSRPLGLGGAKASSLAQDFQKPQVGSQGSSDTDEELPAPYEAQSLPLVDRLAARDRAYGLLSGLTKLGTGWNYSDAWFALARAHEESGQPEKAKEALWWCVELEEGRSIREWKCVGVGGYVL